MAYMISAKKQGKKPVTHIKKFRPPQRPYESNCPCYLCDNSDGDCDSGHIFECICPDDPRTTDGYCHFCYCSVDGPIAHECECSDHEEQVDWVLEQEKKEKEMKEQISKK